MSSTPEQDIVIPARDGRPFEAKAGQYITLIDLEGQQVGDFVALNADDHGERLSTCYTRSDLRRIYVREGDQLSSNLRRPIVEIVEDQVGRHDITYAACDRRRYEIAFGVADHPNCQDNLSAALSRFGVERWQVPEPFNMFQNTTIGPNGELVTEAPLSRPGDRIVLRALMDVVGAVSACAQDRTPTNGFNPTSLRLLITDERP
jgi:uncharacterized protein